MSSFDAAFSGAAESHMQRALEGTAAGSEATEGGHSFLTPEGTTNGFGAGIAAATDLARWNHNSGENLAAEDDEAVIDSDDDIERDPAPAKIPLFQRPDFPVEVGQRFQTAFSGNVRLGETVSSTMKKIRPVVDRYWVPFCQEYGPANKDGPGVLADGVSPRQRMPAVRREEYIGTAANRILQSSDNSTLEDFWNEFAHGRNGNPPLRDLEIEGMDWRRDVPGKTTFKTFWNYRCPMYNLITYYTEQQGHSEAEALEMARPLFDQIEKSRTGRPNLKKISKRFTEKMKELGMYQYRRWKQN